ncbi:PAS domain-containing protein [Streptomyces sp. 3212.3]|uniref:SpoIIE family protein phosphatase n=1 Tax=Streptomyces sp. 3212.3 TaxID=1938846 RepID=UPI000E276A4A|nr:SpoIIE family protein phosphatase [Streptomyces sp. 3212.3]REE66134.1 PAS domain-containing protein [Streptomyces sp. 3212.3]
MRQPADRDLESGFAVERLDSVVADVVRETGASAALLFLLQPGEQVLRLTLLSGVSRQIAAPWARIPVDAPIPVLDAMRQRRLVWLGGQEELARRYPRLGIVLPYDFMLAAAPLTSGDTVWGGIVLLWPIWHPPQLSEHESQAVTTCCRRAADLFEQAAQHGRPLRFPEEPRVLAPQLAEADPAEARAALRFTERLPVGCCALDLEGRLTFINAAAANLMEAGAARLVGKRPWEVLLWLHHPLFEEGYRAALISRQPMSFTAVRPPDTPLLFQLYPDGSGISIFITPAAQSATTGPGQQLRSPDEPVSATALYLLTHLAAAVTQAAGVRDVAERVADQIVPAFGPQRLILMTQEEGRLHIVGHRGYSTDFIRRFDGTSLTSATAVAHVLTTGDAAFFPTFADFQRAYPEGPRYEKTNAWAFLPLTVSGRPIGSLVLSYDQPRPFPPAERAILTSLAGLIAQALDRARLYDTKHTLAHTLQTGLLPHTLPRLQGLDVTARYLPAGRGMDIGGDFYDLIRCDATTATAAIGDVQGHDPTAAALMGQVRTAVHAHAHATGGISPGDVLARTNRLLTDLDPGLFTSCLITHLDASRHRARLANAGHPPPLLAHPDGHTEVLRLPPGLLLGIDPDADYTTTEIPLPPGTVLALYTDGLVETPGIDIDDTTHDLAQHLAQARAQDLDHLADTLIHHATRGAPRHDDIALLLIRPKPNSG